MKYRDFSVKSKIISLFQTTFGISLFGTTFSSLFYEFSAKSLLSVYVFSYFPFGFVGRTWDLILFYTWQ